MYIMLFLITIAILVAAYTMFLHNKVIPNQEIIDMHWRTIDALLRRRMNLVPRLLEEAKGSMQYEQGVITTLNKLRHHVRQYGSEKNNIQNRIEAELELSEALEKLLTAAEKYPDLKTNIPFLNCQKMLSTIHDELKKISTDYNNAAREVNTLINFAPNKFIIQFFGVHQLDYLNFN